MTPTKYLLPWLSAAFLAGAGTGWVGSRMADQTAPATTPDERAAGVQAAPEAPRQIAQQQPERRSRDSSLDWFASELETAPANTDSPVSTETPPPPPPPDANPGDRPSWGREAWTNREAWMEQRRIERQARIESMRSNLVKQAGLDEQQAVRFDVLVTAMNMRLYDQARIWREALEDGTLSRPEVRARAMKEIGTAVSLTYDELDRNMPENWRAETTNNAVNLWTFIDPDIWREMRPLMGGRGRPPGAAPGGGPGGGPGR